MVFICPLCSSTKASVQWTCSVDSWGHTDEIFFSMGPDDENVNNERSGFKGNNSVTIVLGQLWRYWHTLEQWVCPWQLFCKCMLLSKASLLWVSSKLHHLIIRCAVWQVMRFWMVRRLCLWKMLVDSASTSKVAKVELLGNSLVNFTLLRKFMVSPSLSGSGIGSENRPHKNWYCTSISSNAEDNKMTQIIWFVYFGSDKNVYQGFFNIDVDLQYTYLGFFSSHCRVLCDLRTDLERVAPWLPWCILSYS